MKRIISIILILDILITALPGDVYAQTGGLSKNKKSSSQTFQTPTKKTDAAQIIINALSEVTLGGVRGTAPLVSREEVAKALNPFKSGGGLTGAMERGREAMLGEYYEKKGEGRRCGYKGADIKNYAGKKYEAAALKLPGVCQYMSENQKLIPGGDVGKDIKIFLNNANKDINNTSNNFLSGKFLREEYYAEYDFDGRRYVSERGNGRAKNTGFCGEIVITEGKNKGKTITDMAACLEVDGQYYDVPLINPYAYKTDIDILRFGGSPTQQLIESGKEWVRDCLKAKRDFFAFGEDVAPYDKWLYREEIQKAKQAAYQKSEEERLSKVNFEISQLESQIPVYGNMVGPEEKRQKEIKIDSLKTERAKIEALNPGLAARANPLAQNLMEGNFVSQLQTMPPAAQNVNGGKDTHRPVPSLILPVGQTINVGKLSRRPGPSPDEKREAFANELLSKPENSVYKKEDFYALYDITERVKKDYYEKYAKELADSVGVSRLLEQQMREEIQKEYGEYLKNYSGHNMTYYDKYGKLKSWGEVAGVVLTRGKYFFTNILNNSIVGNTLTGVWSGGEAALNGDIIKAGENYRRHYQNRQKFLDLNGSSTDFGFVDKLALGVGALASDGEVFRLLGLASSAVTRGVIKGTSAIANYGRSAATTGLMLGGYEATLKTGNILGEVPFNNLTWKGREVDGKPAGYGVKDIFYSFGRGFTVGSAVGVYSGLTRALPKITTDASGFIVKAEPVFGANDSKLLKALKWSGNTAVEGGLIFPAVGAGYDYIAGGDKQAFEKITPESVAMGIATIGIMKASFGAKDNKSVEKLNQYVEKFNQYKAQAAQQMNGLRGEEAAGYNNMSEGQYVLSNQKPLGPRPVSPRTEQINLKELKVDPSYKNVVFDNAVGES
ncbi:MAG: hypothetical protein LBI01_05175, partial [Elusimicrobium sp.]|nr:hypothetical protein [Elusimicrobium sp.]